MVVGNSLARFMRRVTSPVIMGTWKLSLSGRLESASLLTRGSGFDSSDSSSMSTSSSGEKSLFQDVDKVSIGHRVS